MERKGVKISTWFVTISTNIRPVDSSDAAALSLDLELTVKEMFSTRHGLEYIMQFLEGSWNDIQHNADNELTWGIEIGSDPRGGRVHAHVQFKLYHTGKIHLDYKRIKQFVVEAMAPRCKGCHVDCHCVKGVDPVAGYILKGSTCDQLQDETKVI